MPTAGVFFFPLNFYTYVYKYAYDNFSFIVAPLIIKCDRYPSPPRRVRDARSRQRPRDGKLLIVRAGVYLHSPVRLPTTRCLVYDKLYYSRIYARRDGRNRSEIIGKRVINGFRFQKTGKLSVETGGTSILICYVLALRVTTGPWHNRYTIVQS